MEATCEVCEKTVDPNLIDPQIKFIIWVLTEVEMQELVLVPISVWVHLKQSIIANVDVSKMDNKGLLG